MRLRPIYGCQGWCGEDRRQHGVRVSSPLCGPHRFEGCHAVREVIADWDGVASLMLHLSTYADSFTYGGG